MLLWFRQKALLIFGCVLMVATFLSYQNCGRVQFKAATVQASKATTAQDIPMKCEVGQIMPCELNGLSGTMICEEINGGREWGSCIVPVVTTTTITLPNTPTTTMAPTTTTTTMRANAPCTLVLSDLANPVMLAHGASYIAYSAPTVPASGVCASETRVCMNGSVSGSYRYSQCVRDSGVCQLNGVSVPHNGSAQFFNANVVPFGQVCQSQSRTCRDGVLSGDPTYMYAGPCQMTPPANCPFGAGTILHGNGVDVFPAANVPFGQTCVASRRNCFNGNLDGMQSTITQCQPLAPLDCTVGTVIVPHGSARQFARMSVVPFGSSCEFSNRTCTNGVLSGSNFIETACRVESALDCNFDGQVLRHGDSVAAFSTRSVAYDASCNSVSGTVTCQNGTVVGANNFPFRTCQPATPRACNYFGQTIAHGAAAVSYSLSSVPFLASCNSVQRNSICVDGSFQPALAEFKDCNPLPETMCAFNGNLYHHGASVQAAKLLSVTEPATCEYESRICDGRTGQFSGSFAYPSCTQQVDLSCRNYVYSGCTKKNGSSVAACGYAAPNYFHPEYVCSGNLIYGQYEGPMGVGPTMGINYSGYASPGWATINAPLNIVGAKCVVNQKVGYANSGSAISVLYYDGPPQPGALTTGKVAYPNNQPLITKVKDCGF